MLELHIDLGTAGIVIEEIEQRIVLTVDPERVTIFIQRKVLDQHRYLPKIADMGTGRALLCAFSVYHIFCACAMVTSHFIIPNITVASFIYKITPLYFVHYAHFLRHAIL